MNNPQTLSEETKFRGKSPVFGLSNDAACLGSLVHCAVPVLRAGDPAGAGGNEIS